MSVLEDSDEIRIETAPGFGDDGGDYIEGKRFVEDVRRRCKRLWSQVDARSRYHERMVLGDQYTAMDGDKVRPTDETLGDETYCRNILRSLVPDRVARLTEGRPSARAKPNSAYGFDPILAEMASEICRHVDETTHFAERLQKAVWHENIGGTSALQVTWDGERGPKYPDEYFVEDADGVATDRSGEAMGTIKVEALTVRGFCPDDTPEFHHSHAVTFRRVAPWVEAKHKLLEAGRIDAAERISPHAREERSEDSSDEYEVLSTWIVPNAQFPKGLRVVSIDDEIVSVDGFEYPHGELPCAIIKNTPMTESPWGDTWLKDAIKPQRQLNEAINIKAYRLRKMKKLITVVDKNTRKSMNLNSSLDHITVEVPAGKDSWTFETRTIDDLKRDVFDAEEQESRAAVNDVAGMSAELMGGVSGAVNAAGKSIAYLNKLAAGKMAMEQTSINEAVKRVMRQAVWLYQAYAPTIMLERIVGEQYAQHVEMFRQADLSGLDIVFEEMAGITDTATARAADAGNAIAQGQPVDPELAATGQDMTGAQANVQAVVAAMAEQILNGAPVDVDETLDPATAYQEAMRIWSANAGHEYAPYLGQLVQHYQGLAAQQGAPEQQQGGQAPATAAAPDAGFGGIPLQ